MRIRRECYTLLGQNSIINLILHADPARMLHYTGAEFNPVLRSRSRPFFAGAVPLGAAPAPALPGS